MADDTYISLPIEVDYDAVVAEMLDYLIANVPGYVPREGNLEVWLCEVIARQLVETANVASLVPAAIFRYFGQSVLSIPSIDAGYASMPSTWTLRDSTGHNIPAGTVVAYQTDDGPVYFAVQNDVIVSPGTATTANGEVTLVAIVAGSDANGLTADAVSIVDALAWVDQVTTTGTSSGGVDAETDGEYLDRLVAELRLLSPRPILPDDFAVLARRVAGVARSFAIDGYNPTLNSYNNERVVTVALADEDGEPVSSPIRTQVQSYLDGLREINFSVYAISPTYTQVDVTASLVAITTADPDEVRESAEAALEAYLNPATWEWSATVRLNELISLLDQVEGVSYVETLTVPAADITLAGPAPLARSRTLSISVA